MNVDYTIGDDIVCIKTHSQGVVKEGEVFKCKSLKENFCNCQGCLVDIGIKPTSTQFRCLKCMITVMSDSIRWFPSSIFRKLDTLVNIDEIHELLNEPLYS